MNIMLGNLTLAEMEKRSGVEWPEELKQYMADRHQPEAANVAPGKWHCFDLPFHLICGDLEMAHKVYDHLKPLSASFATPLQIGVQ